MDGDILKGVCHIVGAGDFFGMDKPRDGDFVIAADGGLKYLEALGIIPDIIVGDFDSLGRVPSGSNVIVLPCEKDETDMSFAASVGLERGYKHFRLYGASGGRFDHTLSNIALLASLSKQGAAATMNAGETSVSAITDSELHFSADAEGYISVFSYCDSSLGVNIKNLKYPLCDYTLESTSVIGTSNEFLGVESSVSVAHGTLIVLYPSRFYPNFSAI